MTPIKIEFKFKKGYFVWTVALFIIEVLIALYIKDSIIRPHVGDVIVVILIYCFLRSFINMPVITLATISLLFAFATEALQYFKIVERLGLRDSALASIVIGTHFSWIDLFCYIAGIMIVLVAEKNRRKEFKPG